MHWQKPVMLNCSKDDAEIKLVNESWLCYKFITPGVYETEKLIAVGKVLHEEKNIPYLHCRNIKCLENDFCD